MSRKQTWAALKDNVTRARGQWSNLPRKGAGGRSRLAVGKRDSNVHRSFIKFQFDEDDIGTLHKAELVLKVVDDDFVPGSRSRVTVHRLTKDFVEGSSDTYVKDEDVSPAIATGRSAYKNLSGISAGDVVRIDITAMVGPWLSKSKRWMDGSKEKAGWGKPNHGLRLKSKEDGSTAWDHSWQFASREAVDGLSRPYVELTYDPPNYAPDLMSTVSPFGVVLPGEPFTGEFGDPNGDPPQGIRVQVQKKSNGNLVWNPRKFPFDPTWTEHLGVWTWSVPNPGSEWLKANREYEWRARGYDGNGQKTDWTAWRTFRQVGTAPVVALRSPGTPETLSGYEFLADWATDPAERVVSYRVQLKAAADPWTGPLWDETFLPLKPHEQDGVLRFPYRGPRLPAGTYDIRVQVVDSRGEASPWSDVEQVVLSVGSEQDQDSGGDYLPPNLTGYARGKPRVRIVLRANDAGAGRGPGTVRAIIEDAHNIGISSVVNEPGEMYFTLTSLHPQAGECEPWKTHYAVQSYRNGSWVDIHNGMLVDFDAGDNDIIIYGYDYLGVLARSVDTRYAPSKANIHATHAKGGAKYKNEKISDIIAEQLNQSQLEEDSPLGFFREGVIQELETEISIFSSYKARLDFIRGLLESHRQGTGRRSRLRARQDPSQYGRWEWDLRTNAGTDRDNLRMEYGSLLQNFRVIAMGEEFSTRAMGVGTSVNSVRPRYWAWPKEGTSDILTSSFGNLKYVEVYDDIIDKADLKRRVKQMQKELSKVGKRVRLAIRVHGVEPYDGYDLTDNVPIDIDRGLVETARYGSGYWTIWGLEYRVYPDGHDELTWAIKPREDYEDPDPDLIPSEPIPEWPVTVDPGADPQYTAIAGTTGPTLTAGKYFDQFEGCGGGWEQFYGPSNAATDDNDIHSIPWANILGWSDQNLPPCSTCTELGQYTHINSRDGGIGHTMTMDAAPAGAVGMRVWPNYIQNGLIAGANSPGKRIGFFVRVGGMGSRLHDGIMLDSFTVDVAEGQPIFPDGKKFFVPLHYLPAAGGSFATWLAPLDFADRGTWTCTGPGGEQFSAMVPYGAWKVDYAQIGADFGWGSEWVGPATTSPWPPEEGAIFQNHEVGIGDGKTKVYVGVPTAPGTAEWYVDGIRTEPLEYDAETGIVIFDRFVAIGADVAQSGVGR